MQHVKTGSDEGECNCNLIISSSNELQKFTLKSSKTFRPEWHKKEDDTYVEEDDKEKKKNKKMMIQTKKDKNKKNENKEKENDSYE